MCARKRSAVVGLSVAGHRPTRGRRLQAEPPFAFYQSPSTFTPIKPLPLTTTAPLPQVIKALGRGSYGTVYKVQRLVDGQVYAMKETDIGKMTHQERNDAGEHGVAVAQILLACAQYQ